jgi:hypothetical protein
LPCPLASSSAVPRTGKRRSVNAERIQALEPSTPAGPGVAQAVGELSPALSCPIDGRRSRPLRLRLL